MPTLEIEHLSVSYGAVHALSDVCFTAAEGRGRQRYSARTERARRRSFAPSAGWCTLQGNDPLRRRTPREDVRGENRASRHRPRTGGTVGHRGDDRRREPPPGFAVAFRPASRAAVIDEIYELFPPLDERRRQHANTLSGGERQMLCDRPSVGGSPKVLLLDEPSLGLAPIVTARLMAVLRDLTASSNLVVVLVEQNARSASRSRSAPSSSTLVGWWSATTQPRSPATATFVTTTSVTRSGRQPCSSSSTSPWVGLPPA